MGGGTAGEHVGGAFMFRGPCRLYGVAVLWVSLWKGLLGIRPGSSHSLWAGFSVAQVTWRDAGPTGSKGRGQDSTLSLTNSEVQAFSGGPGLGGSNLGDPGGLPGGGGNVAYKLLLD